MDDPTASTGLAGYASGALEPAYRLLVDTQAALKAEAADARMTAEAIASAFLEHERPAMMAEGALDAALAAIDAVETSPSQSRRAARAAGAALQELLDLPEPLREAALLAAGRHGWKFAGPGIRTLALDLDGQAHADLLRIEPGAGAPRHGHSGDEYTLVVTGAFVDETGRYGPGDLSVRRPGDVHRPVAEAGATCFALAVSEGPIALRGPLGVLQRLLTRH